MYVSLSLCVSLYSAPINSGSLCKQGDRIGIRLNTDTGTIQFFLNGKKFDKLHTGVKFPTTAAISCWGKQTITLNFDTHFDADD